MVDDLDDCYKRYLDYFTVGALDFDARLGQCLSCFHAAHGSPNARAVVRKYLDVVFTVERLESRQSFSYFHFCLPRFLYRIGLSRFAAILSEPPAVVAGG